MNWPCCYLFPGVSGQRDAPRQGHSKPEALPPVMPAQAGAGGFPKGCADLEGWPPPRSFPLAQTRQIVALAQGMQAGIRLWRKLLRR